MIIIDNALEKLAKEGKPIRVGMIGSGFMARGVAIQIVNFTPGIKLVAVANRTLENAKKVYQEAGVKSTIHATDGKMLDQAINNNTAAFTNDPFLLCKSKKIDVILDMTGAIEYGAHVVMEAIKNKKHVVSFNAELDGTIGPILKHYANKAGVIYTLADGDQPGVTMNLYRFVTGIGLKPVLCGNIKGLQDPYRNPTTQEGFAKKWKQNAAMVTSFADGTKISFEQAIVANATGMKVGKRGMHGPVVELGTRVEELAKYYPTKDLNSKEGIVDYVVGASPAPGVFVLAKSLNAKQNHYLHYYKLGEGPFYCFYVPYHLCHFEIPSSIARAVLFKDATITPLGRPMVEVIATAKKDLKKGEVLDQLGGYATYGVCENYEQARKENLLPIGLAEDCVLKRDIKKDEILTFDDVIFPKESVTLKLWKEQVRLFPQ